MHMHMHMHMHMSRAHVQMCVHVHMVHVHVHMICMFTSSGVGTAVGLEDAQGRLRFAGSCGAVAENLGPTEGLETAAAYELDLITAGDLIVAGSSAAVTTTSDAAAVVATALDAAATSDAGSIAFEGIASASASSFSMKRAPSASTALTGPVRPRTTRRLALGWTHASANVRGLVTASACHDL